MSHTHSTFTNAENKNSKIHYQEYLKHNEAPIDNSTSDGASIELNADLIRSSYYQKRKLRHTARRLRYVFSS
jgi:hypothetical protein